MTKTPRDKLDQFIESVPDVSAPSVTKFHAVRDWIADLLDLSPQEVYVAYVSKPGNLNVRFNQPGPLQTRPQLGVAIIPTVKDIPKCIPPSAKLVGVGGHIGAMALVAKQGPKWDVLTVIEPANGLMAGRMMKAFPGLTLEHPPASTKASAKKSPAGSLTFVPLVTSPRVRRMVRLAIASAPAVMLVGPPGTGKTTLLEQVIEEIAADPSMFGFQTEPTAKWVTPEESWTTRELLGGETVDDEGRLRFSLGRALEAIRDDEWLVLDEANRADMDKIFGGLLTWLAGHEVELGRASTQSEAAPVRLGWSDGAKSEVAGVERLHAKTPGSDPITFMAGREWRLLGTYNALDAQRVFRFGQALGRRFVRVPIPPISVTEFEIALEPHLESLPSEAQSVVKSRLIALYESHQRVQGATLGPALFFWMPEYVRVGLELAEVSNLDAGPTGIGSEDPLERFLSEAYLTAAGVWLSRLDSAELDALQQEATTLGVFSVEEWTWIRSLLPALG